MQAFFEDKYPLHNKPMHLRRRASQMVKQAEMNRLKYVGQDCCNEVSKKSAIGTKLRVIHGMHFK